VNALPFEVDGMVMPGKQLGSKLGFPTANIAYDCSCSSWPQEGVYVGLAHVQGEDRDYVTILNQGRHPTAPTGAPTVEAHLLGYPNQALYGRQLHLIYCAYLRQETTFPSLDALRSQLRQDRLNALDWARQHAPHLLDDIEGA